MNYTTLKPRFDSTPIADSLKKANRSLWVGAVSFEERCVGSLSALEKSGGRVTSGIALDYATNVHPHSEDKQRRDRNRESMRDCGTMITAEGLKFLTVDPYALQDLQVVLYEEVVSRNADVVIFDITCMTKIHTMALAAMLAQGDVAFSWATAYSIPENYGNLDLTNRAYGWRDIIVAPLAETAEMFYEVHSRGVVLAGHEADRLIVALAEIEPSGGTLVVADTPKRPDLRHLCERLNQKVFRQLTRMRSRDWKRESVSISNIDGFSDLVRREIDKAKSQRAPVILFPYGPKSLVFLAALLLAEEYPNSSWFVYPIPTAYDVEYSEGISATMWLVPESVELDANRQSPDLRLGLRTRRRIA